MFKSISTGSAILAFAISAILGVHTSSLQSDNTVYAQGNYVISCIGVLHRSDEDACDNDLDGRYIESGGAAASSSYVVEYRYKTCGFPGTWGAWTTFWDEDGVYACNSVTSDFHTYRYLSQPVPAGTYCQAEWRVVTTSHDGTDCCDEDTVTSTSTSNVLAGLSSDPCTGLPTITVVVPY